MCPKCQSENSKVIKILPYSPEKGLVRTRYCLTCKSNFDTTETLSPSVQPFVQTIPNQPLAT